MNREGSSAKKQEMYTWACVGMDVTQRWRSYLSKWTKNIKEMCGVYEPTKERGEILKTRGTKIEKFHKKDWKKQRMKWTEKEE